MKTHPVDTLEIETEEKIQERRTPRRRLPLPKLRLAGAVTAAVLLAASCGGDENEGRNSGEGQNGQSEASVPESTTTTTLGPLVFDLIGECDTNGGVLRPDSDNFTPGGGQEASATVDGEPYPGNDLVTDPGPNTGDGKLHPDWQWDCGYGVGGEPDPEGTYTVTVEDLVTGRRASDTFAITPANP